jgi:hypothetical protein
MQETHAQFSAKKGKQLPSVKIINHNLLNNKIELKKRVESFTWAESMEV